MADTAGEHLDRARAEASACPVCHRRMTVIGKTADEAALMCGYCTYSCVVPSVNDASGA